MGVFPVGLSRRRETLTPFTRVVNHRRRRHEKVHIFSINRGPGRMYVEVPVTKRRRRREFMHNMG